MIIEERTPWPKDSFKFRVDEFALETSGPISGLNALFSQEVKRRDERTIAEQMILYALMIDLFLEVEE